MLELSLLIETELLKDCELDNSETINIPKTIDIELIEKILGKLAENHTQIS
ncbi:hypothetical protein RhiirA4_473317 [Rhizophagus irregularis]|uniref:Uncharacterized protein n=1 Tax=Rhizophagus irregularis TaxID=588596 RepID=A0A2I1H6H9_9GLOM|nr:hypothetical protein RhiirA4_473317 [Rhizophagus irregularis]